MGVVYEAIDRERDQRVALKTLRAMSADALLRFKTEFREFQNLQHPNLITIGELYCEAGEWFFTMELIDGNNFFDHVRPSLVGVPWRQDDPEVMSQTPTRVTHPRPPSREGPPTLVARPLHSSQASPPVLVTRPPRSSQSGPSFNEARLRAALQQLAHGLCALHAANKVHRDIKPSNILVTRHGRVVLLDFGLATDLSQRQHKSEDDIVGTVEYMAPEQAAGRQVGPPADWYAVGVVLFELLTGSVPISGSTMEVLMNKQRLEAPSPRALYPQLPEDLSRLCLDLLRFNPSERPTGEQVLQRLGAAVDSQPSSLSSFSHSSHFVGRARELALLREHWEQAQKGAVTVAVLGESGVGKSALVRRFAEQLSVREPALVVLAGTCYERESVPFKGVDGLIDALSQYMRRLPKAEAAALLPRKAALLASVFPVLSRVEAVAEAPRQVEQSLDPHELRSRLFAAVRELMARLTDRHPVVLVIDDLQWADADSLALLAELTRAPDAPPLLLIATVRTPTKDTDSGQHPVLPPLPSLQSLPLERMAPAEARELAQALIKRANSPVELKAHNIAQEAGGHPLFIDELVRHAVAVGVSATAPVHLEDALWSRVGQLDPAARYVLELVCLAGGRLVQQTAAQAAGMGFGDFGKHVALLRVAHLLRTTGMRSTDFVEPYHGRVRGAVIGHLGDEAMISHHRRLALALETSGQPDPEALATHWHDAGDADKAAHYAELAGDKAARALAFDRAVRFYELCLDARAMPKRALQVKLADALANAGRGSEAGERYLIAADANPADALELRRRAAEQLLRSGHIDRGLETIKDVLATVGMNMPATTGGALASLVWNRSRLALRGTSFKERSERELSAERLQRIDICWSVAAGLAMVDNFRALDYQTRQLLLALDAGEPSRVARALALDAPFVASPGGPAGARADKLLARAEELAGRIGSAELSGFITMTTGVVRFLQGRFADGCRLSDEADALLREHCTGVTWEYETSRFISLWSRFYRGDVRELLRRLPPLQREAELRGNLYALTNLRTAFTPFALLVDDRPDLAEAEADEAIRGWSRSGFHIQHCNALFSSVQTALYRGEGDKARAHLLEQWGDLERSKVLRVQQIRVRAVHFRGSALAAAGAAPSLIAHEAARLEREPAAWAQALGTLLRATVHSRAGEPEAARAALERAVRELDAADLALYAACARRRLGLLVGGDAGAALVEESDRWFGEQLVRNPERMTAMLAPA
jgi:serine/threonine protein kinase